MAEKEEIARRLLRQGLTTSQIAGQLRCSPFFVRRVRSKLESERGVA
jgi:transposase-like protein